MTRRQVRFAEGLREAIMPNTNKDEVAVELARKHYEIEVGLTSVFRISGSAEAEALPNEPIKLLEVNNNTVASGIMPIHFGPNPGAGITFPSVIVEVTPDELEQLRNNRLQLPPGWHIGPIIPRQAANGAG
jgi:hypothetical protein